MRSPITNVWDRDQQCIHFWDGRTVPGEVTVAGNVWTFRPGRPLVSGADWMAAMPLRRLQVSRLRRNEAPGFCWHLDVVGTATSSGGGLAVTDWYADLAVDPAGFYKVENLGDLAEAVHQRLLSEVNLLQALRALESACEGLHRTTFSVPDLLRLWEVPAPGG